MDKIIENITLVKPTEIEVENIELYGYSENSSNDAPACDANGSTSNCKC